MLAGHDVDIVSGTLQNIRDLADGLALTEDGQADEVGDEHGAFGKGCILAPDRDGLPAQARGSAQIIDALELHEHAGLLHAARLHAHGLAAEINGIKIQQEFRVIRPRHDLHITAHAMRADDLTCFEKWLFHRVSSRERVFSYSIPSFAPHRNMFLTFSRQIRSASACVKSILPSSSK